MPDSKLCGQCEWCILGVCKSRLCGGLSFARALCKNTIMRQQLPHIKNIAGSACDVHEAMTCLIAHVRCQLFGPAWAKGVVGGGGAGVWISIAHACILRTSMWPKARATGKAKARATRVGRKNMAGKPRSGPNCTSYLTKYQCGATYADLFIYIYI